MGYIETGRKVETVERSLLMVGIKVPPPTNGECIRVSTPPRELTVAEARELVAHIEAAISQVEEEENK